MTEKYCEVVIRPELYLTLAECVLGVTNPIIYEPDCFGWSLLGGQANTWSNSIDISTKYPSIQNWFVIVGTFGYTQSSKYGTLNYEQYHGSFTLPYFHSDKTKTTDPITVFSYYGSVRLAQIRFNGSTRYIEIYPYISYWPQMHGVIIPRSKRHDS